MKKWIPVVLIFFLTGCYSYEVVDIQKNTAVSTKDKKYELKVGKEKSVIRNVKIKNDQLLFTQRKKERSVPLTDITRLREKRFSWGKTVALTGGVILVGTLAAVEALDNIPFSFGE